MEVSMRRQMGPREALTYVKSCETRWIQENFLLDLRCSGKKIIAGCIRCAEALSELETDDYHPTEVLIMVEDKLARTGYA